MKKLLLISAVVLSAFVSNAQQGVGVAPLVINEVDYDHQGIDSVEFIELYNPGLNSVNLSAYRILFYSGAGSTLYDSLQLPAYVLNANSYYVICGAGAWVANYNLLMPDTFDLIQNGAASSSSGSPDALAIQLTGSSTIVDAVSYEGSCTAPYVENTGIAYLNSDYNNADQIGISRYTDGTDANNNSVDFIRSCITPGAANVSANTNCGGTVGIEPFDYAHGDKFSIYPNPSNEVVNISTGNDKGDVTLSVYDFTGKRIDSKQLKNNAGIVQYNTAQFAEGVYILSITGSDKTVTKKLTVLHR